jgi:DNA repair protein RadC
VGKVGCAVGRRKGKPSSTDVSALQLRHGRRFLVLPAFSRFASRCPRRNPASGRKHMGITRDILGHYTINGPQTESDILEAAEDILRRRLERLGSIGNPRDSTDFLRMRLGALKHEEFHVLWLDNRHRILAVEGLFRGTIDGASVHPREVIRSALQHNAAACIFAHNHPSGVAEPSAADRAITKELSEGLQLIGVRVLDHLVVSACECVSMAARGLM